MSCSIRADARGFSQNTLFVKRPRDGRRLALSSWCIGAKAAMAKVSSSPPCLFCPSHLATDLLAESNVKKHNSCACVSFELCAFVNMFECGVPKQKKQKTVHLMSLRDSRVYLILRGKMKVYLIRIDLLRLISHS